MCLKILLSVGRNRLNNYSLSSIFISLFEIVIYSTYSTNKYSVECAEPKPVGNIRLGVKSFSFNKLSWCALYVRSVCL